MPFDRQNCRPPPRLEAAAAASAVEPLTVCRCAAVLPAVVHERVLVSVYRALQGAGSSPPVFGSHWEAVGFQGADPATDVRGGGVLGLLLLLRLLQSEQSLAGRLQALAASDTQHFPLAVVGLNLAGIVLSALRLGRLNGECGRQPGGVWEVAHTLFAAAVDAFVNIWMDEAATIGCWAQVRQRIERDCCDRGKQMCRELRQRAPAAGGAGKTDELRFDDA